MLYNLITMKSNKRVITLTLVVVLVFVIMAGHNRRVNNQTDQTTDTNNTKDDTTIVSTATTSDGSPATPNNPTLKAVASGTYTKTLSHDNKTRTYTVYVPKGYDINQSYPLFFLMHGGGGTGADLLTKTGLSTKADKEGFIIVAPEGINKNWNDGRGETARSETSDSVTANDDIDFIRSLLNTLKSTYAIDSKRVYSAGISNGSFMSQRMACDIPNTFAAIGAVAGPMIAIADICPNPNPTPVIGFQGTEDPFFPIYDADGIPELPRILAKQNIVPKPVYIDDITEFWTTANGCTAAATLTTLPDTANDGTVVTVHKFNNCSSGQAVVYYIIDGAGHSWPGGASAGSAMFEQINGGKSNNVIANDELWAFFRQYSL